MQSACSGGTGTFIEKTARKLQIATGDALRHALRRHEPAQGQLEMRHLRRGRREYAAQGGVPVNEIIASLFEAVVYQNLATLTKGNTPMPKVLLLGGPNLFFQGLQQAWRHHLRQAVGRARMSGCPQAPIGATASWCPMMRSIMPASAASRWGRTRRRTLASITGTERLEWWIEEGQHHEKAKDGEGERWIRGDSRICANSWAAMRKRARRAAVRAATSSASKPTATAGPVFVGCDFGSTTAKAVVLSPEKETCSISAMCSRRAIPIEDAKAICLRRSALQASGRSLRSLSPATARIC